MITEGVTGVGSGWPEDVGKVTSKSMLAPRLQHHLYFIVTMTARPNSVRLRVVVPASNAVDIALCGRRGSVVVGGRRPSGLCRQTRMKYAQY